MILNIVSIALYFLVFFELNTYSAEMVELIIGEILLALGCAGFSLFLHALLALDAGFAVFLGLRVK